ncbi:MAG: methyltransferase domain-containing protein [Patescibacteria group bacterium]
MREPIKQFVEIIAETLPISSPVYEFGSLQVPGQVGFADLRPFFPKMEYVGCDMREGIGVDRNLNLHNINLPLNSVGAVLILDTLEHVEFPRRAMEEVQRILKPGGFVVISSVMNFPIHGYPEDYWRFTPQAFKSILKPLKFIFVDSAGDNNFPHTIVGVGCNNLLSDDIVRELTKKTEDWKKKWYYPVKGWRPLLKRFTPPKFLEISRKIRRLSS